MADKLINMADLIMLIPIGRVPAWMVFLIIGREVAVSGLRGIASSEGIVISANTLGKQKTLTQNTALFLLLWYYPAFGVGVFEIGTIILWLALALTYISGVVYFREFFQVLQGSGSTGVSETNKNDRCK